MYWINTKQLKNKLRSGTFSDRDAIPYIIADGVLINLAYLGDSPDTAKSLVVIAVGILAVILGTWFVFNKHDPDSQSSFLKKYISLGWVVSVHCLLLFIPFLIVFAILLAAITGAREFVFEVAPTAGAIIFSILYYLLLGKHISET